MLAIILIFIGTLFSWFMQDRYRPFSTKHFLWGLVSSIVALSGIALIFYELSV